MPDFKTIADFRKDNGAAIRRVCREFVELSRQVGVFTEGVVAIDGSKFKAVNNRDKNFTPHKLQARMQQVSLTDPDARSMATSGRGTGIVGYNVQTAVDTQHHMIVAHEVTNIGHDRTQLTNMATAARDALGHPEMTALAARGYFKGEAILQCAEAGIRPLVPKPLTSGSKTDGRFDKRDFVYDPKRDEYRCPAGERALWRFSTVENGLTIHKYWSSACPRCPIKSQCTPSPYRRITRWEHEQVLDDMQHRLDRTPEASRVRRQTVEHPFGTLKAWMGSTHFLTKTLPRVRTEMSLHVLAYNLKRMLQSLGTQTLVAFMKA
jgi:hypothetical protein